jgi:hypothetical protein
MMISDGGNEYTLYLYDSKPVNYEMCFLCLLYI